MAGITRINPDTVAAPIGLYSHGIRVPHGADLLFVAGQGGFAPDGSVPPDIETQADHAFRNLVEVLRAGGMTPEDLVKLTVYLVTGQPLAPVGAARRKHLGEVCPASTLTYVPQLIGPEYLVEVEGIAARQT